MARLRTIKIAALNIAMHNPHSPERYVSLFQDAARLRMPIALGSFHGAMLGSISHAKNWTKEKLLAGEVFRFVKIDASHPWFNLQTSEVATEDDMEDVQIPDHLLPNLQRIEFVFNPLKHELWFICEDRQDKLGVTAAARFFQALFDRLVKTGKYPPIEVTPIPDMDTLDQLFSIHQLEKITIELKRPNADDGLADEIRLLKKLESQNTQRQKTEMVAVPGKSIQPDAETRKLAEVAARNGNVSIIGRDASGLRIQESTVSRPLLIPQRVDQEMETSMDVLKRVVHERQL